MMRLYLVQDSDRPLYVTANTMGEAVRKWQRKIFEENSGEYEDMANVEEPQGVQLICEENELLWEGRE